MAQSLVAVDSFRRRAMESVADDLVKGDVEQA